MLTPETIASRRFDKQMGGYKQDEVEIFLQQVAAEYAKLLAEKEELEQKIEVLVDKVEQYREDEDSLRSALIGAQKLGDSVIRESKAKADYIVREAKDKADRILENAQKSIEKEQMALIKMQKEVTKFKNRLLTLYRQHLEMISALPEYDDEEPKENPQQEQSRPETSRQEPMTEELENTEPAAQLEKSEAVPQENGFGTEESMIDFTSALDNMEETTSFAAVGARNAPAPAAQHPQRTQPSQGYSPFGGASSSAPESKFGPLKFGEGFDVERDSTAKNGSGLFSRKKHR